MITLTEDDVRQRLHPTQVISAIESAFRDRYHTTVIPNRTHLPTTQAILLIMPCYDRAHIQVLPLVRRFERVLVCGTDPSRTREFASKISEEARLPVESVDAQTCVSRSDVLCTCTTSQVPLFDGTLLRPGTHLNLVG